MRKKNPVLGVSLRLIVAGYLLYIAYIQFSSIPTTDNVPLSIVFGILFAAVGVFFAIWAILAYRRDTRPEPEPEPEQEPEPEAIEAESEDVIDAEATEVEDVDPIREAEEEELEE